MPLESRKKELRGELNKLLLVWTRHRIQKEGIASTFTSARGFRTPNQNPERRNCESNSSNSSGFSLTAESRKKELRDNIPGKYIYYLPVRIQKEGIARNLHKFWSPRALDTESRKKELRDLQHRKIRSIDKLGIQKEGIASWSSESARGPQPLRRIQKEGIASYL